MKRKTGKKELPAEAYNWFCLADHQGSFPIADGFGKNRILSKRQTTHEESGQTGIVDEQLTLISSNMASSNLLLHAREEKKAL